jgi:hypothetical protein
VTAGTRNLQTGQRPRRRGRGMRTPSPAAAVRLPLRGGANQQQLPFRRRRPPRASTRLRALVTRYQHTFLTCLFSPPAQGWKASMISSTVAEAGGYKEVILQARISFGLGVGQGGNGGRQCARACVGACVRRLAWRRKACSEAGTAAAAALWLGIGRSRQASRWDACLQAPRPGLFVRNCASLKRSVHGPQPETFPPDAIVHSQPSLLGPPWQHHDPPSPPQSPLPPPTPRSRGTACSASSSGRPGCTACSACRRQRRRAACTPARPRWRSCPRWVARVRAFICADERALCGGCFGVYRIPPLGAAGCIFLCSHQHPDIRHLQTLERSTPHRRRLTMWM